MKEPGEKLLKHTVRTTAWTVGALCAIGAALVVTSYHHPFHLHGGNHGFAAYGAHVDIFSMAGYEPPPEGINFRRAWDIGDGDTGHNGPAWRLTFCWGHRSYQIWWW